VRNKKARNLRASYLFYATWTGIQFAV